MEEKYSDILMELWSGNICPMEEAVDKEIKDKYSEEITRLHYEIAERINDNLLSKFSQFDKAHDRYTSKAEEISFKKGFSLAVKLMSAAYNNK